MWPFVTPVRTGEGVALIYDKGRLVRLVGAPIEIELMDYAGGDALMLLAKKEQKAVRTRRENMNCGIGGIRRNLAHVIGYLFSEVRRRRGVPRLEPTG